MLNLSFEEWARFGSLGMEKGTPGTGHVQAEPRRGMRALKGALGLCGKPDGRRGGCRVKLEVIKIHLVPAWFLKNFS